MGLQAAQRNPMFIVSPQLHETGAKFPGLELFATPADDDEDAPHQTWMLATTHPSAILRTPDEARAAAYDALVADLRVVAHALA